MAECHTCRNAIRGESGVKCQGVCGKVFHPTNKCSGLDQYSVNITATNSMLRIICDDCVQYIHNVDMVLNKIEADVNKSKQNLIEYKNEFQFLVDENKKELKELLKAIEKRYMERVKQIEIVQKESEKNNEEIKKLYSEIKEYGKQNKNICEKIEESNTKICSEIKKAAKEKDASQNKVSFADTVKQKQVLPNIRNQVPLIIKPKEKQNIKKTKEDLRNKVDPTNFKINNIENRRNGTMVIESENNEEREKIKNTLQTELSENYDIRVPNETKMTIVITDMSFKIPENELINILKKQNPILVNSELKIIKTYDYKRKNVVINNVKLIIDKESYIKVISQQKLNVGWEKCRVFDGTDIIKCFKCKGYNHKSTECKNQETCYKCHGNHKSTECDKAVIVKCINCTRVNEKLNMGLDENHDTNNRECPVYLNKLRMKKKRLGLTD